MPIPPDFLEQLRDRIPVSAVVGRRLRLVRAGREMKACCPFHQEKTPSFFVVDAKGFFHCHGCGAHGDSIGFLMRHDGLSFLEAVEHLAGQAGLPVPQATPEEHAGAERRKGLHQRVEAACRFFEDRLQAPEGRRARDYLAGRGLDDDSIARFRLGYAPGDGAALIRALRTEGFDADALVEAGVARRPEDGRDVYSFFRHRVIFPVTDRRGRVVAFGARLLDGDGPKYLNSPETAIFEKGRLLYGLDRAVGATAHGHTPVVAEGYMDVIALARAGFEAAVAPLGTALTETHLQELWRLHRAPVLCFDGDAAGRQAAERAAARAVPLLRPDHTLRFAFLRSGPDGHPDDPDSLLRRSGKAAMRAVVEAARPLADVLWEREIQRHDMAAPEGRAGLERALDDLAASIADRAVANRYRDEFRQRCRQAFRGPGAPAAAGRPPKHPEAEGLAAMVLLAALLAQPALADELAEPIGKVVMPDEDLTALQQDAVALAAALPGIGADDLRERLRPQHGRTLARLSAAVRPKAPHLFATGIDFGRVRDGALAALNALARRQGVQEAVADLRHSLCRENLARMRIVTGVAA